MPIRQVSAERIRQTVEKLVSFGNRSTISAQDEESVKAGKGIGAAREWIKSEFERYAKDCGGCLEVKTDTFTEQPAERIPKPTEITNVYAVLRGSDPKQADRIVLVTGHYDSRNSDTLNVTDPAPGANDDASGTAVSLECARIFSKAQVSGNDHFSDGCGRRTGSEWQQALRPDGQAARLETRSRLKQRYCRRQPRFGTGCEHGASVFRRTAGSGERR